MNTKILLFIILNITFFSCSKESDSQLDGYWQLKNITYPNGTMTPFDSIFYAFQHERLFSFTSLLGANTSNLSYGFVYSPTESQIQVSMDTLGFTDNHLNSIAPDFLEKSTWKDYKNTFQILILTGRDMELSDSEGKVYSFKKH